MVDETCQIVGQILENHETFILFHHDFLQCDHVPMSKMLQQSYLTHRCYGKSISFALHPNLLQSHLVFGIYVNRLENFPICACTND